MTILMQITVLSQLEAGHLVRSARVRERHSRSSELRKSIYNLNETGYIYPRVGTQSIHDGGVRRSFILQTQKNTQA